MKDRQFLKICEGQRRLLLVFVVPCPVLGWTTEQKSLGVTKLKVTIFLFPCRTFLIERKNKKKKKQKNSLFALTLNVDLTYDK